MIVPDSDAKLQNRDCSSEPLLAHKRHQVFPLVTHRLYPPIPTPKGPIALAKRNSQLSKDYLRAISVQYLKAAMGRTWKLRRLRCR